MNKLHVIFKWAKEKLNVVERFNASKNRRTKLAKEVLHGKGIEIGALHNPIDLSGSEVKKIIYVDKRPIEDLIKQYPEIPNLKIVKPDIIDDAEVLKKITNNYYDFIIANHIIEHMENPIKAIVTWLSKLKKGGIIFMAVPDKRFTFDKNRKETTWEHLLEDYLHNSLRIKSNGRHFLEFAKIFPTKGKTLQEKAKELMNKRYSIHYHCWTHNGFEKFLNKCQIRLNLNFIIISSLPPLPFGIESIFVLKKN